MAPYADPIIGFHRFLDSLWINDLQQPIRTVRAFKSAVAEDRNRIYMRIGGGMLAAYDVNTFINRLQAREELVAGGRRMVLSTGQFQGYDLYLKPDRYFYAESDIANWYAPLIDGQERLYTFDWDDRGYVYMAYTYFGWGIAKDDGGNVGGQTHMPSVVQICSEPTKCSVPGKIYDPGASANNIFVLKTSAGRYYAYVSSVSKNFMNVWDVTNPAAPVKQTNLDQQVVKYAKMGNQIAIVKAGNIEIYTVDGFVNRTGPFATLPFSGYQTAAVATDGTRFFAALTKAGNLSIATIDVAGGSATSRLTPFGAMSATHMEGTNGYLTVYGPDEKNVDVLIFKLDLDGTPQQINLNKWVQKYYVSPDPGYVRPPSDQSYFAHAGPLRVGNKIYIILSVYGLGDVIEIKSADGIAVERVVPDPTKPDLYFGDTAQFVATTPATTPKNVIWNFGNPEGVAQNTASTMTGPTPIAHTYSGFTSATAVSRTVTATEAGTANQSSVNVTLKPPVARFRVLGGSTSLLFTQPNASSPAPIVLGDVFVDESDGDLNGHLTTWTLDGVPTVKTARQSFPVGACGGRSLSFVASYGVVQGAAVAGAFNATISPFNYTVRPFAAAIAEGNHTTTHLNFISASRGGTGYPASVIAHQWDLVNATDQVLFNGGTATTFSLPKVNIVPGSRVRLKVTHPNAVDPTACPGMTESTAYFTIPNPPDPVIIGGCVGAGDPPCIFKPSSATGGQALAATWTNSWVVTGAGATPTTGSGLEFNPTFTLGGPYTVKLTSTNAVQSVVATMSGNATAASLCPDMVPGTNIFLSFAAPGCNEITGTCSANQPIYFNVGTSLNYSINCAPHTYLWNIKGQQFTTREVTGIILPAGTHSVSVVVSNGKETKTLTETVTVGGSVQPPPPPTPPQPPPPTGGCGTMNSSNVFVTFASANLSCNENNPNSCQAGQEITFNAGSSLYAGYNLNCTNHTFSWTIDGQPKSGQGVKHTYTTPGQKQVSLTINNGTQQFTTGATLTVVGNGGPTPPTPPTPPPSGSCPTMVAGTNVFVSFVEPSTGCNENNNSSVACGSGQLMTFNVGTAFNYSLSCATHSFEWDFGNGVKKTGQSVTHSFAAGTHAVKVTITNGAQTLPVTAQVRVGGTAVTPDFTIGIAKSVLVPGTSIFKFEPVIEPASAKASIQTYAWNFGDGKPVLEVHTADAVFHEYMPACPACSVTLTVYDAFNRPLATVTESLTPSRRRSARH